MYKEKQLSLTCRVPVPLSHAIPFICLPKFCCFPILTVLSSLPPFLFLYARILSPLLPSSQLVPCAPLLQFRLQHVRVLCLRAQLLLLLGLPGLGSVPVGSDRLVVPDHGGFCVTNVALVSCVMGRVHQKGLGRKCMQVPTLKVSHVLRTDERVGGRGGGVIRLTKTESEKKEAK